MGKKRLSITHTLNFVIFISSMGHQVGAKKKAKILEPNNFIITVSINFWWKIKILKNRIEINLKRKRNNLEEEEKQFWRNGNNFEGKERRREKELWRAASFSHWIESWYQKPQKCFKISERKGCSRKTLWFLWHIRAAKLTQTLRKFALFTNLEVALFKQYINLTLSPTKLLLAGNSKTSC